MAHHLSHAREFLMSSHWHRYNTAHAPDAIIPHPKKDYRFRSFWGILLPLPEKLMKWLVWL